MRFTPFGIIVFFLALAIAPTTHALTNGVGLTPPMGWNSWYANGSGITEQTIKDAADAMATNGMKAAGYEYVCMDDGWAGYRDTNGVMVSDPVKFPSGIKALADYVHAKGFKFGIYTVFGELTCASLPGSYGHVVQDANTYAAWGVDYVKYEGCSFPDALAHEVEQCELMGNALLNTGRPMFYNLSIGPAEAWMTNDLNSFRGTGDASHEFRSMLQHLDFVARTPELAGPGHWNDPDVLESGFFSREDLRTQFSMWCIVAAPLLNTSYGAYDLDILTNREVIAVDQDPAGVQGVCVATNGDLQVWCKPLGTNGAIKAVALLNRGTKSGTLTANWSDLGLPAGFGAVRDLWAYADTGNFTNSFTATLPGHGVRLLKIVSGARVLLPPPGTNYLSDLHWLSGTTNPFPIALDADSGGTPMSLHGITYPKGLGAHAASHIEYLLEGTATRFQCNVGVDDSVCCVGASVIFQVWADGIKLFDSGVMTSASPTQSIDVDLTGRNMLVLEATDAGDGNLNDHADWAGARIVVSPAAIELVAQTAGSQINLTWDAPGGATNYAVQRSTSSGGPYQTIANVTTNRYTDASVVSDTVYYYVIAPGYPNGRGANSTEASATLFPTWSNTQTGLAQSWNLNANWANTTAFPNQAGRTVLVDADIVADQTINLNQTITVGSLTIGDSTGSAAYTIAANGGTLLFDNGSVPAALTQTLTSKGDTISAPVLLLSNLALNNNSANPFTLSGVISGSQTLTKTGSGVLALNGANIFSGAITIAQGTLQAGNAAALGTTAAGTTIAGGATLDINGVNLGPERITVSGAGMGGKGALVNSGAPQPNALQYVTLAGNTTFGGANRWDVRATNVNVPDATLSTSGQGYKLTKITTNQFSLAGVTVDPALGDIDLQAGIFAVESATTSLGNPANVLTIFPGATLQISDLTNRLNKQVVINGDGVTSSLANRSGSNTLVGPLTLNGACVLDVAGTVLALAGPFAGSGGLIKVSGGSLCLYATNTYAGDTLITAGTLALAGTGSIVNNSTISLYPGAVLDGSGLDGGVLNLLTGQSLVGNGSVKGNFMVGNGATLAPGNAPGSLVFSNALTFTNDGRCLLDLGRSPGSPASVQVLGSLTYAGTLMLTNFIPGALSAGDSYKLFNAGSYSGTFESILPQIPASGLLWDGRDLTNSGTLRVVAGIPPHINTPLTTSSNIIFTGAGGSVGQPGGSYFVLTATNVTLPFWQWTRIATNQFDAAGNFTFTNRVDPLTLQQFYSLQLATAFPRPGVLKLDLNPQRVSGTGGASNGTYFLPASTNAVLPSAQ